MAGLCPISSYGRTLSNIELWQDPVEYLRQQLEAFYDHVGKPGIVCIDMCINMSVGNMCVDVCVDI